jgi:hypothetical protein
MIRITLPFCFITSGWLCGLLCAWTFFYAQEIQAVETIVVGEAGRPWNEGGGDEGTTPPTLPPQFRLTPRIAGSGNAPGGIIDFEIDPGWIVPTQIDPDRNLFELIREQGGSPSITSPNVSDLPRAELQQFLNGIIDGSEVVFSRKSTPTKRNINTLGEHIDIDLGARFGIERILFYPSPFFPGDFLKSFEINLNDGTPANLTESGNPLWTLAFRQGQNTSSQTEVQIPLQFVRHLRLTSLATSGYEIDEFELYGRGFVPTSSYLSDVFDLGDRRAIWGKLLWSAEAIGDPNKSSIFVRTRTGNTSTPLVFTRVVTSRGLVDEPSLFEMDRISYNRAIVGLLLAPVEVPEQTLTAAEYNQLSVEIGDWLEITGGIYSILDDGGAEQTTTRAEYEASDTDRQGSVFLPATQILPDAYKALSSTLKDWLDERAARYFRRANITENVPYEIDGQPLDATSYNRLSTEERGPILDDIKNWSPWSAPYPAEGGLTGTQITSPAPRRYLQFEIRFESDELEVARKVDFLSFEVSSPPVAQRLVAEIFPREVQPGLSTEFTYAVKPSLDLTDVGFDSFEIQTPVPIQRLLDIQVFDPEGKLQTEQIFGEAIEGLDVPYQKGDFALVSIAPTRFRVRFPRMTEHSSVLKIRFVTSVLRFGTTFQGWAFNAESDELPQPAVSGNVTQLGTGDVDNLSSLSVFIDLGGPLLSDVRAFPNPFTPNGDGVNDQTEIFYDVLKLTEATQVEVDLYNLAGRRLATLQAHQVPSGRYAIAWDGTDGDGQKVSPGLYLFKVKVKADVKAEETLGTIAVVY